MAFFRDILRVCEANRIIRDHLDFLCDVEIYEYYESTIPTQIGDNTYIYTGAKKDKAPKEGETGEGGGGGASTTEDEDDDMLGDEAVLISRSAEDVDEARVRN